MGVIRLSEPPKHIMVLLVDFRLNTTKGYPQQRRSTCRIVTDNISTRKRKENPDLPKLIFSAVFEGIPCFVGLKGKAKRNISILEVP